MNNDAATSFRQALALHQGGKLAEAKLIYEEILGLHPRHADSLHLLGVLLKQSGRLKEGARLMQQAVEIDPLQDAYHSNLGNAYREMGEHELALSHLRRALEIQGDYPEALNNLGLTHHEMKQYEDALACYDRALTLRPSYANALYNKGNTLKLLRRLDAAVACYDAALSLAPNYFKALNNKGAALYEMRRWKEAAACYESSLALNPSYPEALHNLGLVQTDTKDLVGALRSYEAALLMRPAYEFLPGSVLHTRMKICQWAGFDEALRGVLEGVQEGRPVINAFPLLSLTDDPSLQRQAASIWARLNCVQQAKLSDLPKHPELSVHPGLASSPAPIGTSPQGTPPNKIRLGYFSADLHNHATAYLMAELFELHDRDRFELFAFSFGPSKQDEMRQRLLKSFDHFIDVSHMSDPEVAGLSQSLGVDIAVDLKGYTQDQRANIFAHRAAPVQASFIGYPGTMGAPFMDYLIADSTLVPQACEQHYDERIVFMPDSYQVNDRKRHIDPATPTRQELGLPEVGFVYCCFNNNYKITPEVFGCWVRVLRAVPGSVLWLLQDNEQAASNLRLEAAARGLDPTRLVFAKRAPLPQHLARHRAADLFLDTFPYNAHTTASDALWSGLPVLTRAGESFASRVGASLLNAVGLPGLVTHSLADYEGMAIELASSGSSLASIRGSIARGIAGSRLFDTEQFARALEKAFVQMHARRVAGLGPEHIVL
jgi:predicted O-linked N-acetylglucosamine transferase (SPINDLY family)